MAHRRHGGLVLGRGREEQPSVMCFAPGRTALLGPIAEKYPQLQLILDHMGLTAAMLKDRSLEAAIAQTVALAKYPTSASRCRPRRPLARPYPFRDVAPILKRMFDATARGATAGAPTSPTPTPRRATASASANSRAELPQRERQRWVMGRGSCSACSGPDRLTGEGKCKKRRGSGPPYRPPAGPKAGRTCRPSSQ